MSTQSSSASVLPNFDVEALRRDFPILAREINGKPLVFLDSAASAQKPRVVLESLRKTYEEEYANVHRGVYWLSATATKNYENVRKKLKVFFNAKDEREFVFTKGTTEGINLVAQSWGRAFLKAGDEVLITALEHHSNIVPWQMLRDQIGIKLVVAPINAQGELIWDEFQKLLSPRTKLVSVAQVSNALGTILPIDRIIKAGHAVGAKVLIDAAQGAPHMRADLQALDCDFYAFSGHKLYGPTGTGALWGKKALLDAMPPWQGGGDMIKSVTFEKTDYADVPAKFEAGTPNIADVIAMGAALDWLSALPWDAIEAHEADVLAYGTGLLRAIPGLRLIGDAKEKASVISFVLEGVHPHDIGTILDQEGVSVRAGNHCAEPVMEFFGVPGTARASIGMYSTRADMDALAAAIRKVQEIFA
ncbi:MAG TPA: cysteine desulfurase [Alphaproteobacteria bacterium]|jgi:cysteine desulfurase/selenocysteine lyase